MLRPVTTPNMGERVAIRKDSRASDPPARPPVPYPLPPAPVWERRVPTLV
jgi:hypothetical protein